MINRIARVLLAAALFWAPLGALAQPCPRCETSALTVPGASAPGQIEKAMP